MALSQKWTTNHLHFSLGKETKEIVDYLWTRMEDEIIDLLENPSHLNIHGQDTVIHYEIEASQFDKSCLKKDHWGRRNVLHGKCFLGSHNLQNTDAVELGVSELFGQSKIVYYRQVLHYSTHEIYRVSHRYVNNFG